MIAEYEDLDSDSAADDLARRYIYGPGMDRPVAMIDFTTPIPAWYYYHQDALGNVAALSNNDGNLAESYRYTPFGSVTFFDIAGQPTGASAVKNPYLFTARRYDDETSLYYYRARMYNPQLGRFMQPDPIGYYDAMNLYQYCGNNPVNWVDPSGLMWGWVEAVWNWLTEDAAQTVAEEVVEQAVEKLYVPDGDTSATGECAQAAPKLGIPERIPRGWEGVKECNEQFAARAAKEAADEALNKAVKKIDLNNLKMSNTVGKHAATRPYQNSPSLIKQIVESGKPAMDPGGLPGGLRWDAPGYYNGSTGVYELVIDTETNTIVHFLFRSSR